MVYSISATHNEYDHIIADHREDDSDGRFNVGPDMAKDWAPPTLIYCRGTKKIRPNIMQYDQIYAFTADIEAIEKLSLNEADWCRLVPIRAEMLNLRLKPFGLVEFTLFAVTRIVDAVDRSRTTFKPYGDEIFDTDMPGVNFFHRDRLPSEGMFHHKCGAGTRILTFDDAECPEQSFKRLYESTGLTGLVFKPFGEV